MHTLLSTHLAIEGLTLDLFLGSSEEERSKPQSIEIDVLFFLSHMPLGCVSDEPKDVISPSKVLETIQGIAKKKQFQLIEHLAYEIHTALKKEMSMQIEIMVRAKKFHPQRDLKRGMSFTFFPQREQQEKKPSRPWDDE